MLKTSYRSYVNLGENGSLERFKYLKSLGYDAVDYQNFSTDPYSGLYALSDSEFEAFIKRDVAIAKDLGLEIIQTHGVWPYDDTKKEKAEARLAASVKSIKGTAMVGAKYVVMHPFLPTGWKPSEHRDEDVIANIEFFRKLVPYAREYGVKIAIENMPVFHMMCGTIKELADCVDAIDSEYFVACLDTGHCNMSGKKDVAGENVGDAVRFLGNRMQCLHIHDNDGKEDQHLFPYLGTVDWADFLAALRETNYQGSINFECRPPVTPELLKLPVEKWLSEIAKYFAAEACEKNSK